jgi:hypothetical protein
MKLPVIHISFIISIWRKRYAVHVCLCKCLRDHDLVKRFTFLHLWIVFNSQTLISYKVYLTECPYGFHGKNCATPCNTNCIGCNRFTGRCETGCLPGWKGTFCDKGYTILIFFFWLQFHNIIVMELKMRFHHWYWEDYNKKLNWDRELLYR